MKYEQVDVPREDAVNVDIYRNRDGQIFGAVTDPLGDRDEDDPAAGQAGEFKIADAMKRARELASRHGCPVVVLDVDNLWDPAWGVLYRP